MMFRLITYSFTLLALNLFLYQTVLGSFAQVHYWKTTIANHVSVSIYKEDISTVFPSYYVSYGAKNSFEEDAIYTDGLIDSITLPLRSKEDFHQFEKWYMASSCSNPNQYNYLFHNCADCAFLTMKHLGYLVEKPFFSLIMVPKQIVNLAKKVAKSSKI